MAWTDERVELLKQLWAEGLSASQIANTMGDVTRNAVIGKVHRLGLAGRAQPPRVSTATIGGRTLEKQSKTKGFGNIKDEVAQDEPERSTEERVTLLNLTRHTCRWPIGEPKTEDFYYCGARTKPDSPYCEEHAKLAYQPVERRRKARSA